MSYDLAAIADEFLHTSDHAFDECREGISGLDRIIIATPALLVDRARGYFVALLYAYRERFFRVSFGEYLRCFSLAGIKFEHGEERLLKYRLCRQLAAFSKQHGITMLHELPQRSSPSSVKAAIQALRDGLDAPLAFNNPAEWVETEANVKFTVLETNCKRFCVDIDAIKDSFTNGTSLFESLNNLVKDRNDIAHGAVFTPYTQNEWETKRNFVLKLMQVVQTELYRSLSEGSAIAPLSQAVEYQI